MTRHRSPHFWFMVLALNVVAGVGLAAVGAGQAIDRPAVIVNTVSDVDGFGFGPDICPIGCTLPGVPLGPGDPDPFDAPDIDPVTGNSCATTVTWTHDVTAGLPPGAEVVSALLILNAAGIEPTTFPTILTADSTQFPLVPFEQGQLGSGLIPVPINPDDLSDSLLDVTITKGFEIGPPFPFKLCDDQFYDVSMLILLINAAVADW